jgi:hypothetical protein
MIAAHCGNEAGIGAAVATTVGSAPVMLALFRARIGEFLDRLRGRA